MPAFPGRRRLYPGWRRRLIWEARRPERRRSRAEVSRKCRQRGTLSGQEENEQIKRMKLYKQDDLTMIENSLE